MNVLSFLTAAMIPSAFAQTLIGAGSEGPGVSDMWSTICATIPCSVEGGLVGFFTSRIVAFVFSLIGVVSVCLVIYAGIRIIAYGQEGLTEAKKILTMMSIGIVLALSASAIVWFLQQVIVVWLT